jgi:hypothetical protein
MRKLATVVLLGALTLTARPAVAKKPSTPSCSVVQPGATSSDAGRAMGTLASGSTQAEYGAIQPTCRPRADMWRSPRNHGICSPASL